MGVFATALVLIATSGGAFDPNAAALPPELQCADALSQERSVDGEALYEGEYSPRTPNVISNRVFRGDIASVIYLCEDSVVFSRLVVMRFDTESESRLAFEKHRHALLEDLGPACWDPESLSAQQLSALPRGDLASLGWFRDRIEWNAPHDAIAALTLKPAQASLTFTPEPRVGSGRVIDQVLPLVRRIRRHARRSARLDFAPGVVFVLRAPRS